jgi:hypothetical protein
MNANVITWSANNNSSYLNGERTAKTIRGAARDARRYLYGELYGEGIITYYKDGKPVRQDERSIRTGYRMTTTLL